MAHHDSIEYPQAQADDRQYSFTPDELAAIDAHAAKYPDRRSAVMPALWIAQEKWGWLPQGAMQLVADTLGMSFAHVYGVATFYTMYLKQKPAQHLIEVCTCFTCGECGGRELMDYACQKTNANDEGVSADGQFWFREAECLGACDTPTVLQINNDQLCFNVTPQRLDEIMAQLQRGEKLPYEHVPMRDQSILGA